LLACTAAVGVCLKYAESTMGARAVRYDRV